MRVVASIRQRSFARFVAFDLAEAARRLGWAVHWIDFDALTQRLHGQPRDAWLATLDAVSAGIRAFEPDVVFSYGIEAILPPFPGVLPDEAWCLADEARAPVACFFYDFGAPFDRPVDATTTPYVERLQRADIWVFCWDRRALADLQRFGVAAEYLPMAVNDAMFFPPPDDVPRDVPIVFTGGPTLERVDVLRRLAPHGLAIYGYDEASWRADADVATCFRGLAPARDQVRALYQHARITVNVTRAHGRASLGMRVFEAMACGCAVITDQAEEAASLFTPGEDLVTVREAASFETAAAGLLADETLRASIASRGARVVRDGHTYVHRLQSIAARLRALTVESRAVQAWDRMLAVDPAKALRFLTALRADRPLLREDCWAVAEATARLRLGQRDLARRACDDARRRNPALLQLRALEAVLGPA